MSECLGARELFLAAREGRSHECTPKWLRNRTEKLSNMKQHIEHLVQSRSQVGSPIPVHDCNITTSWVTRHSIESLHDSFRPICAWLPNGWAANVVTSSQRTRKSTALF